MLLLDSKDLNAEQRIGATVKYWTAFHEVGHLLGLEHVNAHGPGVTDPSSTPAYGVTRAQKNDVMGKGSVRTLKHALPWQQAAASLTNTKPEDWRPSMRSIPPEPLRR